jgi:hypothetical protein
VSGPALLRAVVTALEAAEIPFMVTGSFAAAYHGAARATMDIDLVIEPTGDRLTHLVELLRAPGIYVSADAAQDALARESMFNVVDATTGWKADLIVRKSRPFSRTEFARRRPVEVEGVRLWVATVEDTIIAKLEWAKLGGSARQLEDVAALLRVRTGELDRGYLDRWIADLGLDAEWRAAQQAGEG